MIGAVHIFNAAGLTFRAELFVMTAIVAWTYFLHAYFKREGVNHQYNDKKTAQGAVKYWDLSKCISTGHSPISSGAKLNLEFLIELRNEIAHQSTSRIDDAVGMELQACCINFNDELKKHFGNQYGLEKRLPLALQFVSFGRDQRSILKEAFALPPHVSSLIQAFESGLTDDQVSDPAFRYRVAFVPISAKKSSGSDECVVVIKPGSEEAEQISEVIFKEVNRARYIRRDVLTKVRKAGFPKFGEGDHTKIMQQLNAKDPSKGYGCKGDYKGSWVWFDKWIERVIEHCQESGEKYR
ncbi:Protein of unknown function [Aliiruegeria lutimaris]|uniref:DUF3644 domain-containing protein n=2 Tax=Aliiruegeria lutimaris TaxID=571298 RepID=A0A1G8UZE9_9RHOB|nr:DUF3644 domain-containing protein [Aliiruegeria lutimaris]SDJ58984.1 Protein of unknown function [Aliiruegeria lutimaris]